MQDIVASTQAYEDWLERELAGSLVRDDIARKHEVMAKNAFRFLRATYWRWCETAPTVLKAITKSPVGLAVGDIHMDNFGTFRDAEGRLVWGINDFDEAAPMPLGLDLVRLLVSAAFRTKSDDLAALATPLLAGYRAGLEAPAPIVLDQSFAWLRALVHVPDDERQEFWDEMAALAPADPPTDIAGALRAALPDPGIEVTFAPRTAGGGSLGRPRWVAKAGWRGGLVVREAKRLVPSAWTYAGHAADRVVHAAAAACGPYRSPDPWYRLAGDSLLVRRLSPNNRKIDIKPIMSKADLDLLLDTMGRDLAAVHAATEGAAKAMTTYLRRSLDVARISDAALAAKDAVATDFKAWRKHHGVV